MRRRVLMASRTRYALPLSPGLERKFAALDEELDLTVLAAARDRGGSGDHGRFRLLAPAPLLDGPLFYARFPFAVARELRRVRPEAVLVQGAPETALVLAARRLARVPAKVILDLHGDPGTSTRLYGSRSRRLVSPLADRLSALAIRRADGVRTLSPFTTALVRRHGVEPAAEHPAFMDLDAFVATPPATLPERPAFVFVGVLERYKAFEILVEAWRRASAAVPDATLHVVGRGALRPLVEELVAEQPGRVRWTPTLPADGVAAAMDEAFALLLPSRSEGLPRIVVEALCRGRCVLGSTGGGIPDIVEDGVNGLVVPVADVDALAAAIVRLADRDLAVELGAGATAAASRWISTPADNARRTRELVDRVVEGAS